MMVESLITDVVEMAFFGVAVMLLCSFLFLAVFAARRSKQIESLDVEQGSDVALRAEAHRQEDPEYTVEPRVGKTTSTEQESPQKTYEFDRDDINTDI